MRKTLKYRAEVQVDGQPVAVTAHLERRANVLFSIARRGVILRLPQGVSTEETARQLERLQAWVAEALARKPELAKSVFGSEKTYKTGDVLAVGARRYLLNLRAEERDTNSARLENGTISLVLSTKNTPKTLGKAIRQLLSRVVAGDFQTEITRRVLDLNHQHFQRHIRSVNLKYNHSNWGSCSSRNNVNLSTRLLFAPPEVQDYVIVHELAHLVELNHSDRFWALVARAMPDYEEKERWLKKFGKTCDF